MPRKPLTERERENAARVRKNLARIRAECNAAGRAPDGNFPKREAAYLAQHPHLAEHKHCGLCEDSDTPKRKVELPNGIVIWSSWYKVPTTEADTKRDAKDNQWLLSQTYARP